MTDETSKDSSQNVDFKSNRYLLIVIIIGFVMAVIFGIKSPVRSSVPSEGESNVAKTLVDWIPWILALCVFYLLIKFKLVTTADLRRNNDAVALLQSGKFAEAEAILTELIKKGKFGGLQPILKINFAMLYLQQQRFEEAKDVWSELLQSKVFDSKSVTTNTGTTVTVFQFHADYCAIIGDVDGAERSYERARKFISVPRRAQLVPTNAMIQLRRGSPKSVAEMPDSEWLAAEATLTAVEMKRLRLFRAFALKSLPPTPQTQEQMQTFLAGVRPFRPGEFDYLAAKWPELKTFLIESGLSSEKPAT